MANELELKIVALAQGIAGDVKNLRAKQGTSVLNTTAQNISDAINELNGLIGGSGAVIDDSAGNGDTNVVYSADRVFDLIEQAKQEVTNSLTNGAGDALNTFSELEAALGGDANFANTIANTLSNKVDFSTSQTLTSIQRTQACENIGVGNPNRDFLTDYITERDS